MSSSLHNRSFYDTALEIFHELRYKSSHELDISRSLSSLYSSSDEAQAGALNLTQQPTLPDQTKKEFEIVDPIISGSKNYRVEKNREIKRHGFELDDIEEDVKGETKHNEASQTPKQFTISSKNTKAQNHKSRGGLSPGFHSLKKTQNTPATKMDLVYVTEKIISVVFPLEMEDSLYTLHLRKVAHMLSSKHGDSFKVFDISINGEVSKYLPRVTSLGWARGLSPPLERLCSICKALDSWLQENSVHIAVLHSRSGYEKLGVVLAAYIHYNNICASTDQALDRYAMKRYFDDKIGNSLHPSQKRYVEYFAGLLSGSIRINSSPLYLQTLTLYGVPNFESRGGCHFFIKIYQGMIPVYTSGVYSLTEDMRQVTITFESCIQLRGDVILKAYHRRLTPASREIVFRVQFHTCAVSDKILPFAKHQLDDACNDLRFPFDGGIELHFSTFADAKPNIATNVSCDKSPCAITAWDSYDELSRNDNITQDSVDSTCEKLSHTLGPVDGSLYATVSKRRSDSTPHSTHSTGGPSPSPHGTNGRYAASIDSGIASSNSAGVAPLSPPTSDTSRTSGETGVMAPVTAHTPRSTSAAVGKSHADSRQLDELLAGMLLDIQNIPDLKPSQTPVPDIESIRCPDFNAGSMKERSNHRRKEDFYSNETAQTRQYGGTLPHYTNGYTPNHVPYHSRNDSKPFSYGAVTSSPLLNRHRTISSGEERSSHHRSLRDTNKLLDSSRSNRQMGSLSADGYRQSSRSPSPELLRSNRSHTITSRIMGHRESSPTSSVAKSNFSRSSSRLDEVDAPSELYSRSYHHSHDNETSWLENQQKKLHERRFARVRAEKGPQEARMFNELKSRIHGRECEDDYMNDTMRLSETSRESSPTKTLPPLTISVNSANKSENLKGNSAPNSPDFSNRTIPASSSIVSQMQHSNTLKMSRKHSDATHDRERAFVAVKKSHDSYKTLDTVNGLDSLEALCASLSLVSYPSRYNNNINLNNSSRYTNNNSTTNDSRYISNNNSRYAYNNESFNNKTESINSNNNSSSNCTSNSSCSPEFPNPQALQGGDNSNWASDTEVGINRPTTPGFPPSTPTTPYLNQLPPKSPTALRKEIGSLRSPSPATSSHMVRHEINGHASPSPSLYHGHSRRSSLTSLNDSMEVISTHPKFVKDISKFWYKPNISRDDAINMLRDKSPGTFVVRDSNSFPGAFGLALKVSTPPPNVSTKSTSDPTSELVRHFLIEPTSRGVRLKGCANEPVFGSLSALVYQHSITALALPCRLVLPDRDAAGSNDPTDKPKNEAHQLLQQGAACNVLYLYSIDTESLTGPQAVKRAIQLMLAGKNNPTVVHLKVSSQGITLTDNSRQLFFRRHYPVNTISHCGMDPDDRRWSHKNDKGEPVASLRMFGFVAKKGSSKSENQCHVIAEYEPEQPATAICNFITKVMMTSVNRANLV